MKIGHTCGEFDETLNWAENSQPIRDPRIAPWVARSAQWYINKKQIWHHSDGHFDCIASALSVSEFYTNSNKMASGSALNVLKGKMQNLREEAEKYKDMYSEKCTELAEEQRQRSEVGWHIWPTYLTCRVLYYSDICHPLSLTPPFSCISTWADGMLSAWPLRVFGPRWWSRWNGLPGLRRGCHGWARPWSPPRPWGRLPGPGVASEYPPHSLLESIFGRC